MKFKLKNIFLEFTGPYMDGDPTFRGTGNFGIGGQRQLAANLNPATEKIRKQEDSEHDQNVDDERWNLGKYQPLASPLGPKDNEDSLFSVKEGPAYDNSINRLRDLPGFPVMNTLVRPKQFVPDQEDDAIYLGPTLDGKPLQDDKETEEDLNDLLGDLSLDKNETDELILFNSSREEENIQELLNNIHATYPNKLGRNNMRINSLAWYKNQISPDEPPQDTWRGMWREPSSHNPSNLTMDETIPLSHGAIGFPKNFVPADYEIEANKNGDIQDGDPLGSKRLQMHQTHTQVAEDIKEELKINDLVRVNLPMYKMTDNTIGKVLDPKFDVSDSGEYTIKIQWLNNDNEIDYWPSSQLTKVVLSEQSLEETFKSQAQRGYFYWKSSQGGKSGKKWKKMAKEFEKETPKNKQLPNKIDEKQLKEIIRNIVQNNK